MHRGKRRSDYHSDSGLRRSRYFFDSCLRNIYKG